MARAREAIRAVAGNSLRDGPARPAELPQPWQTVWDRTGSALAGNRSLLEAVRCACLGLPAAETFARAILDATEGEDGCERVEKKGV